MTDLREWLNRIDAIHPQEIELGLARSAEVWRRLGAPAPAARVVSIAGTNGKGTCGHFLERALSLHGLRTGLYTSPHLLRFNERMRAGGECIRDDALIATLEEVDEARGDVALTFFEYTTLAALLWFSRQSLDVALLEVGLGGRLDAVNIVDATVAVVTSIDLDHQHYLGDTRAAIAREKAGIFRGGRPAVCADPEPPATLREVAESVGALAVFRGDAFHCEPSQRGFNVRGEDYRFEGLPRPPGAPLAPFAAAIEALARLDVAVQRSVLEQVLAGWSLPGRLQRIDSAPEVWLDVAHNPQSARALARALAAAPCAGATRVVAGMMRDKDLAGFVHPLRGIADEWIAASVPPPRGLGGAELAGQLGNIVDGAVEGCASVAGAMALATARSAPDDRLVVCGSFQVVGPALAWLGLYSAAF